MGTGENAEPDVVSDLRMALRRIWMLAAVVAVLAAFAPAAMAQSVLPDPRTHVDLADSPAGAAGSGDPDSPRLTYLRSDTHQSDVRAGYLYVLIRCNFRCDAEIT